MRSVLLLVLFLLPQWSVGEGCFTMFINMVLQKFESPEKASFYHLTGLPEVRGKKEILQGQGKVREFHFESGKKKHLGAS